MSVHNSLKILSLGARFDDDDDAGIDIESIISNETLMAQLLQHDSIRSHISTQAKTAAQSDVEKLSANNQRLLEQLKTAKGKAGQFDDLMSKIQGESDLDDLQNGRLTAQQLIDKNVAAARESWQVDFEKLTSEKSSLEQKLAEMQGSIRQSKLNEMIGNAAVKSEHFNSKSTKHFLKAASDVWKSEEDGSIVARDADGNVIMGRGGKPITPDEWISGLPQNEEFQHYFNFPSGSGAKPGQNSGSGLTMTREEWKNKMASASPEDRLKLRTAGLTGQIKFV